MCNLESVLHEKWKNLFRWNDPMKYNKIMWNVCIKFWGAHLVIKPNHLNRQHNEYLHLDFSFNFTFTICNAMLQRGRRLRKAKYIHFRFRLIWTYGFSSVTNAIFFLFFCSKPHIFFHFNMKCTALRNQINKSFLQN